ncbi:MAG TPA: RIP metalloprotease [Actinomycetota bacterium]|nr:RIP metalloprotease [Actinomycetota bacterium]
MPGWVGVLLFVLGVLVMILAHEAGHFLTAKWFGIKVEEFFVGFGPRLWSFRRGETEYGIKAIPAGGYVRIAGMNPFQEPAPEDRDRVFTAKPAWQRAIVLVTGSLTHFVLAFVTLVVIFGVVGEPVRFRPQVVAVERRLDGLPSPAFEAGMRPGDQVVAVAGRPVDYETFSRAVTGNVGREVTLVVERDGSQVRLRMEPILSEVEGRRIGRLGVVVSPGAVLARDRAGPVETVQRSAELTGRMVVGSFQAIGRVFGPEGIGRLGELLAGDTRRVDDPVGIVGAARVSGQAVQAGQFDSFLLLFAFFNVFVGIVNLLPLPPLDGGHLAVLGWESLTGRRVDPRKLIPITAVVAGFLILFTISMLYLDVVRPLPNPFG